ncbi:MAG: GerW family sporulation protein [Christensenellales bacterium]|jgi:sporulation protein YtfJ|nr:spore germination protein GerW family protein [Clostridia bacterium]HRU84114.1 spore germination protein GerW family protein [Eubacteriales bacterium]
MENNIENIVKSTLTNFEKLIGANNVLGTPVLLEDGTVILPVSKVSFGFFTGGGEYGEEKKKDRKSGSLPYAGGGGGGISISPIGFLVQKEKEEGKFVKLEEEADDKWMSIAKTVLKTFKKQ